MDSTTDSHSNAMQSTAHAQASPEIQYDACIDYVTAFWDEGNAKRFPETQILEQINGQIEAGHKEYSRERAGVTWFGAGGAALGRRDSERFYRASSDMARAHAIGTTEGCSSYSRIDLAVTSRSRSPERGKAARGYQKFRRLPPAAGKPRRCGFVTTDDDGETFTVGSRSSNVYLRMYDYGVCHQVDSVGCRWRYEAELKGNRATSAVALLRSAEIRELAIRGLVHSLFTDRRVEVPDFYSGEFIKLAVPIQTDRMATLAWLRKQVAPSVQRLIARGQLEQVIDALGLSPYVSINHKQ